VNAKNSPVPPVATVALLVDNRDMARIDKDMIFKVWDLLDKGNTAENTVLVLKDVQPINAPETRTVQRLNVLHRGFKDHKTDLELATKEWSAKKIGELRVWWKDYCRSKYPEVRRQHTQALCELAKELRKRIINPEVRRRPYEGRSIWYWGGQDWRLVPTIWFSLVTPFLEAENFWGLNFPNLMSHMSESPFLKHYHELESKAVELQRELNQAAEQLGKVNPSSY